MIEIRSGVYHSCVDCNKLTRHDEAHRCPGCMQWRCGSCAQVPHDRAQHARSRRTDHLHEWIPIQPRYGWRRQCVKCGGKAR